MRSKDDLVVEKFRPELTDSWDSFLRKSRTPLFLLERNYMDYHADRFEDHSLVVWSGGQIVALFPANQTAETVTSHGGLTYGGLVTGMGTHAADILLIFGAIGDYYRARGVGKIIYKVIPSVFRTYPSDEDAYALTRSGATLSRRDLSSVIELAARPKLSDSRKNTARKAFKAGARWVELQDMAPFHALLASVLQKFGTVPVHSAAEMGLLKSRFPAQIRLFATVLDGKLLAGALVFDLGHIVHTQYLASSEDGRRLGALDFLIVSLIEEIFANKKFLSFGISTEDGGRVLNEGLSRQKEGFGGRGIVHDFYNWIL